ncbi:MAG: hypothetical protein KC493_01540 [Bacteriovoracaceae bacterium]|nr:hypothetical protein [Bacteriovoracaceae bacterium]
MKNSNKKIKKIKGQNTAEYLILLVLIAVGSIGVSSYFGKTLEQKMTQVTSAISGNTAGVDSAQAAAIDTSEQAVELFETSSNGMKSDKTMEYGAAAEPTL